MFAVAGIIRRIPLIRPFGAPSPSRGEGMRPL
jgi:hypothetical protein